MTAPTGEGRSMSSRKRFSILVVEGTGAEKELCQVDSNPNAVVAAALGMTRALGKRRVAKYDSVRCVDNEQAVGP